MTIDYIYYSPIDNPQVDLMAAIHNTDVLDENYDTIYAITFLSSEAGLDFFYSDRHAEYNEAEITEAIELHASQWRKPPQQQGD